METEKRHPEENIFLARTGPNISDQQRLKLVFNEFDLLSKDVEIKSIETRCKSNAYNLGNNAIMLLILVSSAVIAGLSAASDCVNIPAIVLAAIIFVAQGADKLFSLGTQGTFYKQGTVNLRRIKRDVRNIIYTFHKYDLDEALFMISKLRDDFDQIDLGLYKISVSGQAQFTGGNDFNVIQNVQRSNPTLSNLTPVRNTPHNTPPHTPSHVHIHIDHDNTPPISRKSLPSSEKPSSESVVIDVDNLYML